MAFIGPTLPDGPSRRPDRMARQAVTAPEFFGCRIAAMGTTIYTGIPSKIMRSLLIFDNFRRRRRTALSSRARAPASHRQCRQMTRLEDPPPWLRPAYCFALLR